MQPVMQEGQHIHPSPEAQHTNAPPSQVHQAPQTNYFDGEMRKSEPEPGLEAHPAMMHTQDAKFLSEGQQAQAQQQPQLQGNGQQQENMAYPGNGGYQTAIPLKDLGRVPAPVDCPRCNRRGLTNVECESGGFTK